MFVEKQNSEYVGDRYKAFQYLSELLLALVGDKELTETQQKAADIDGDGAVKLADLAKFKQYLSKQIESLGILSEEGEQSETPQPFPTVTPFK